jgi:hypothetical protein
MVQRSESPIATDDVDGLPRSIHGKRSKALCPRGCAVLVVTDGDLAALAGELDTLGEPR